MSVPSVEEARQNLDSWGLSTDCFERYEQFEPIIRAYVEGELTPNRLTIPCETCDGTGEEHSSSCIPDYPTVRACSEHTVCRDCVGGRQPDPETIEVIAKTVYEHHGYDWNGIDGDIAVGHIKEAEAVVVALLGSGQT